MLPVVGMSVLFGSNVVAQSGAYQIFYVSVLERYFLSTQEIDVSRICLLLEKEFAYFLGRRVV